MNPISRPVLRYHGGKFGSHGSMADWIVSHFPPHRIYVEPFGGAASVLMRKPRSHAEVYNDLWDDVVTVFRVLRDPLQAAELERLLRLTPYARSEFEAVSQDDGDAGPVERARRIIFRSFAGFASGATNRDYVTGFRSDSHRRGTTPAGDWCNYPNQIEAFTDRLRGVTVECSSAADVMISHDSAETLHYVDPPYVHASRRGRNNEYAFELSEQDHRDLAQTLHGLKGPVILSGYDCRLYREIYADWRTESRACHADSAGKRTEVLWLSPAVRQHNLFAVS